MNYSCENCVYNTCCEANKRHCVKEGFDKVLSTLSPREEFVIKYLYGYDGVCHSIADAQRNIQLECESIIKTIALRTLFVYIAVCVLRKYTFWLRRRVMESLCAKMKGIKSF